MKILRYSLLFICFTTISAIMTMPAQWLLKQLPESSDIQWGGVTGSWHHFSLSWLSYKNLLWEGVNAELELQCLLTAELCVNVYNEDNNIQLKGSLLRNRLLMNSTDVELDLADIQSLLPPLLVQPSGRIQLKIAQLEIERPNNLKNLMAELQWSDIGIQGENFNLGKVIAKANYQQPYIIIKLSDQSKVMDLNGEVKVDKQGEVITRINIKPLNGFPDSIKSLLNSSMQRQSNGFYSLNSRQRVPAIKTLLVQF